MSVQVFAKVMCPTPGGQPGTPAGPGGAPTPLWPQQLLPGGAEGRVYPIRVNPRSWEDGPEGRVRARLTRLRGPSWGAWGGGVASDCGEAGVCLPQVRPNWAIPAPPTEWGAE